MHGDNRAGGRGHGEVLLVDSIDIVKQADVGQIDISLSDVIKRTSGCLEQDRTVVNDLHRLLPDAPFDEMVRMLLVDGQLARGKDEPASSRSLGIRSDGFGRLWCVYCVFHARQPSYKRFYLMIAPNLKTVALLSVLGAKSASAHKTAIGTCESPVQKLLQRELETVWGKHGLNPGEVLRSAC